MNKDLFSNRRGLALGLGLALGALAAGGCGSTVIGGGSGGAGGGNTGGGGSGSGGDGPAACADVGQVDLLLAIDNSRSMADKTKLLGQAVPELVKELVNPPCVDAQGAPVGSQPGSPLDPCPAGSQRAFPPQTDLHIGIISSSIGGHGSDSCPNVDPNSKECSPAPNTTNNDKGHLLARLDQCGTAQAPTYGSKGFLAWDPAQKMNPPGESVLDDGMGNGLAPTLRDMVVGVGEIGCGYESQLESVYRFLADPAPYQDIQVIDNKATPMGTDTILLQQRAEFLRPNSTVAVVMLSDENDCSTKEYGQFYYVNQLRVGATNVRLPRARQVCATNPNDPCCKSCGQGDGECAPDPTCKDATGHIEMLTPEEDDINLRCWEQKRRFGIDFLYPVDRYTKAFTSAQIEDQAGNLVQNPLFAGGRAKSQVIVTGIVGVPWQDIARDPSDAKKGYKTAAELAASNTWNVILGDPANDVKPTDPLMIESVVKRTGTNPVTGAPLVDSSNPGGNPINGHEWNITHSDDLQYACIFPLPADQARDCTDPNQNACDCFEPSNDNPLCANNPNNGNLPTLQVRAKAYPGIRQLSLLKSLGDQAVVGSVCPPQITTPSALDHGYRPVVKDVISWLSRRGC